MLSGAQLSRYTSAVLRRQDWRSCQNEAVVMIYRPKQEEPYITTFFPAWLLEKPTTPPSHESRRNRAPGKLPDRETTSRTCGQEQLDTGTHKLPPFIKQLRTSQTFSHTPPIESISLQARRRINSNLPTGLREGIRLDYSKRQLLQGRSTHRANLRSSSHGHTARVRFDTQGMGYTCFGWTEVRRSSRVPSRRQ